MGIFSDKCPECGAKVKKAARFCGKCGHPAPGGWWKCPECGKWVGNDSNACWSCGAPLHPESRMDLAGGVWQKPPGLFAQRFEVGDVRRLVKQGLRVQEGTTALLMDGGALRGVAAPGRHTLESLARTINNFGSAPPRSVILVDNGDVGLPMRLEGLRSSEDIPLEFFGEVVVHFNAKNAAAFLSNLLKDGREVQYEDLAALLEGEVRYAVENVCNRSLIEDLLKDPDRRLRLGTELSSILSEVLERNGLQLVRVGSLDFTGKEYEVLRAKAGAVELRRREIEFDTKLRDLLESEQMGKLKSEADLEEYIKQLAQESDVADEHRQHEIERLKQVHRQEIEKAEVVHALELRIHKVEAEIGIKERWDGYERGKKEKDAEVEDRIARIDIKRGFDEASEALKLRAEKERLAQEDLEKKAAILEGKDLKTLLMLETDPGRRQDLLRFYEVSEQAGKSAEELLALAAAESPAAAEALARVVGMKNEKVTELLAEMKRLYADQAARGDRVTQDAMKAAQAAATRSGPDVNVVR